MRNVVKVKDVYIGGDYSISIQSMTNIKTSKSKESLEQVMQLLNAGCDLVRVAIEDYEDINGLKYITENINAPIIADIQYDYRHAIAAIYAGASKIRINPSYIKPENLKVLSKEIIKNNIPIRVGVNEGSVRKEISAIDLAKLAINNALEMEKFGVNNIVLAVKSSDIKKTIDANRFLHETTKYPLHIGLTEAGTKQMGFEKSLLAIGSLLLDGIGSTIRVSLADDPIEEVFAAKRLLNISGINDNFVNVIACPTCGRTQINVAHYASIIEKLTKNIEKKITIAVMGCAVNGIGESKGADLGICGGKDRSILFANGKIIKEIENDNVEKELLSLVEKLLI